MLGKDFLIVVRSFVGFLFGCRVACRLHSAVLYKTNDLPFRHCFFFFFFLVASIIIIIISRTMDDGNSRGMQSSVMLCVIRANRKGITISILI